MAKLFIKCDYCRKLFWKEKTLITKNNFHIKECYTKWQTGRKGNKLSKTTKEKLRKSSIEQFKNGMPQKTKIKISLALKGKNKKPFTKEHRDNISNTKKRAIEEGKIVLPWKGKKMPIEQRIKLSKAFKGRPAWNKGKILGENKKHSEFMKEFLKNPKNHWNYVDGRSKKYSPKRYGDDWDKIRYLIYLRDNFTCQKCGKRNISLDVHHIIPFLESFDNSLKNLISLCRSCHMKEENKGRIAKKTKQGRKIVPEYIDFKEKYKSKSHEMPKM